MFAIAEASRTSESKSFDQSRNALLAAFPDVVEQFSSHFRKGSFTAGSHVAGPSKTTDALYFIEEGVVSLLTKNGDRTFEAQMIGPEGCVGGAAWLTPVASPHRHVAQTDGVFLKIDADTFRRIASHSPEVQRVMSAYNAGVQSELVDHAVSAACRSATNRLAHWLLAIQDRAGVDEIKVTQGDLANRFGLQRTTVNQVAQTLMDCGAISYRRGRVKIANRDVLEREASRG